MARNTRSSSNKSSTDNLLELSSHEAELLSRQIKETEKHAREQAEALNAKDIEIQKLKEQYDRVINETQALPNMITDLLKEISTLKHQVDTLQKQPQTITLDGSHSGDTFVTHHAERGTHYTHSSPNSVEQSPIRLKDVAESIPKYDGQRISVLHFSKICERSLDLIPPQQEFYLVQLIINKLQGHAYTAIEGSHFSTVCDLTRKLKQIFGPNKSLNQYKGELGNAFMKSNENILDYVARIKELRTAIIDGEFELNKRLDDWIIDNIDSDVLDSFVNGLPSELLIRVKLEGFRDLEDAYVKAIQVSKTLETEKLRQKPSFTNKPSIPLRQDVRQDTYSNFRASREISPINSNTNYPPQSILRRPQAPFIKPLIPGQPGPNAPSSIMCRYCKTEGHYLNDCKKLQYRNSMQYRADTSNQVPQSNQQPSSSNADSGNAKRAPVMNDVHRDATDQTGRRTPTVRFQDNVEKAP